MLALLTGCSGGVSASGEAGTIPAPPRDHETSACDSKSACPVS